MRAKKTWLCKLQKDKGNLKWSPVHFNTVEYINNINITISKCSLLTDDKVKMGFWSICPGFTAADTEDADVGPDCGVHEEDTGTGLEG